jgi:hypothetical protein
LRPSMTKKVFRWDFALANKNWSWELSKIFDKLGMREYFDQDQIVDLRRLDEIMKKFTQGEWEQGVVSKLKLRICKLYKTTVEPAKYITLNLERTERSTWLSTGWEFY